MVGKCMKFVGFLVCCYYVIWYQLMLIGELCYYVVWIVDVLCIECDGVVVGQLCMVVEYNDGMVV